MTSPRWCLLQRSMSYGAWVLALMCMLGACRSDPAKPRTIRGHSINMQGVMHAAGLFHGARLCVGCHGAQLEGGSQFEPSCFTCHGQNWSDVKDESMVPADHTSAHVMQLPGGGQARFLHHPSYLTPDAFCSACHGTRLEGTKEEQSSVPACITCHEKLWE